MSESPTPGELNNTVSQHWQKMQDYHALGAYPGNSKKERAAWRRMYKKARGLFFDAVRAWAAAESHQEGQEGPQTGKHV